MKHHFPKSLRYVPLLMVFFGIILTFLYCDKENVNVGVSSVDQCCEMAHLEGVVGNAKIYVPNIFTPNNDGINDLFGIYSNDSVDIIESFIIKDKSGKTYFNDENFEADDFNHFWDGRKSVSEAYVGIFVYEIILISNDGEKATFSGEFCSCPCEDSGCTFNTVNNALKCTFGIQHNGVGGYDPTRAHGEVDCI